MANDTKAFFVEETGVLFSGRTRLRAVILTSTSSSQNGVIRLTLPNNNLNTLFKAGITAGETVTLDLNEYPILFKDGIAVQSLSNCNATIICDSLNAQLATLWSPGDFAETKGWWDASDEATISEDASKGVDTWSNKQDATLWTMEDEGAKPITDTTRINGLNVIDFTSTARFTCPRGQSGTRDGDWTIVWFGSIGTVTSTDDAIFSMEDSSARKATLEANNATQFDGRFDGTAIGSGVDFTLTGGPYSGNTIMVCDLSREDDSIRVRMNGEQRGAAAGTYDTSMGSRIVLKIMSNPAGNRPIAGSVGEFIVAKFPNGYVGSKEYIEKAEGYLAYKWGIQDLLPADHPYKTNPPREE